MKRGDNMRKRKAIRELTTALYHTQEYVGDGLLPRLPGWSWFDALTKYAPALLETPVVAATEGRTTDALEET